MAKEAEDKIRDYYLSEDGEWLVEKGKMREARLLKEAYYRINDLKRVQRLYMGLYDRELRKNNQTQKTLELAKKEERQKIKDSLYENIMVLKGYVRGMEDIIK